MSCSLSSLRFFFSFSCHASYAGPRGSAAPPLPFPVTPPTPTHPPTTHPPTHPPTHRNTGTSFATPLVASSAALLRAYNMSISPCQASAPAPARPPR